MNYIEKIKAKLKQSNGIITSKQIKDLNIPTIYLSRMLKKQELNKLSRGVYIDKNTDYDEFYFFSLRFSVPVFSYVSALYFHELTDIIPNEMEVTVYKGYNAHSLNDNVIVHYVNKDIYDLGITIKETPFGNTIRVYDLERTVCDFIKNRDQIEAELFSTTINRYARSKNKNLDKLYEYSKKMKIVKEIIEIMQIVL
ncbi:abortive phage infection protein [Ureaplasma diversum]|uniref:Abortive phage infection protein n=1 Tax=Ureaplasma diversum TaxID=42094 RepID=A0A0C5S1V4_9BACT|nr:type IV toxin-antitoxin system AbiEi family antitoxin domain-containing protein [Ureaplasma diversum]AJQ45345.1 abortive phage infection protein [Ureaplasma diversum]